MIIFKGTLSDEANKHVVQELKKVSMWVGLIVILMGVVPLSMLFLINDNIFIDIIISIFIITWITTCIVTVLVDIKDAKKNLPRVIEITEDYISCDFEGKSKVYAKPITREIEQVVDVQDFGDYYIVYFSNIIKTKSFVCQKDLLVEGTLEEFEELFEDTLVRQTDS